MAWTGAPKGACFPFQAGVHGDKNPKIQELFVRFQGVMKMNVF